MGWQLKHVGWTNRWATHNWATQSSQRVQGQAVGAALERRSSTSRRPSSAASSPLPSCVTCLSPQGSVLAIIPSGTPPTAMPSCPSTHPHPLADTLITSTHIHVWTHKTPLKTYAAHVHKYTRHACRHTPKCIHTICTHM